MDHRPFVRVPRPLPEEMQAEVMSLGARFGEPLQHIINAYAYGDVWSRPGLSLGVKSLAMIAMMAAANRPAELRVHLKGALKNGCTPDEIREVLLLVALYCGIPAANEAHRAAMDVLAAGGTLSEAKELLGHVYTVTTMTYAKVDLKSLRELVVPFGQVPR